jgi:hypothetical protein
MRCGWRILMAVNKVKIAPSGTLATGPAIIFIFHFFPRRLGSRRRFIWWGGRQRNAHNRMDGWNVAECDVEHGHEGAVHQ